MKIHLKPNVLRRRIDRANASKPSQYSPRWSRTNFEDFTYAPEAGMPMASAGISVSFSDRQEPVDEICKAWRERISCDKLRSFRTPTKAAKALHFASASSARNSGTLTGILSHQSPVDSLLFIIADGITPIRRNRFL